MRKTRNILKYRIAPGAVESLFDEEALGHPDARPLVILDRFFRDSNLHRRLLNIRSAEIFICDSAHEPRTEDIDDIVSTYRAKGSENPSLVVGIGGGSSLDTAKAVSNLMTNGGKAADYQG